MTTKYRINWRTATGTEGHGQPIFNTHKEAAQIADARNNQYDAIVHHWVEPVEVAEEERCNPAD